MSKISQCSDLYLLLNIFLKTKFNLLRDRKNFLCDEFFQCELKAIDNEIAIIKNKINQLS